MCHLPLFHRLLLVHATIFTLCVANDDCRLPTDPIDAFRYAMMIRAEDSTLSLLFDDFEGQWSRRVEDSFGSYYTGERFDDIIYSLHGIFVSPLGVLLYGQGGTPEQRIAPLSSVLIDAGYRRPYLNNCTPVGRAIATVAGPAPVPPDLTFDDVSTLDVVVTSPGPLAVFDDIHKRSVRVYDDGFPDIVAPGVSSAVIDEPFIVSVGGVTTPGSSITRVPIANSGDAGVLYGLLCGGVISGTFLFFLGVSMYCRRSNSVISTAPLRVEPSHLPSSLDIGTGIYPQCRGDGGIARCTIVEYKECYNINC